MICYNTYLSNVSSWGAFQKFIYQDNDPKQSVILLFLFHRICSLLYFQTNNKWLWVYIISIINSHISTENIQRLLEIMWHSQCVLLLRPHPSIMLLPNVNLLNSTHIICTHLYSAIVPNFGGYKFLKDKRKRNSTED